MVIYNRKEGKKGCRPFSFQGLWYLNTVANLGDLASKPMNKKIIGFRSATNTLPLWQNILFRKFGKFNMCRKATQKQNY